MRRLTTVVVPPVSTALTTVNAVSAEIPEAISPADMARLTDLIDEASSLIVAYLGRPLAKATIKDVFLPTWNDEGGPQLVLSRVPVIALVSVLGNGVAADLTTVDYASESGLIYRGCCAARTEVTYDGGYVLPGQTSPTLPKAIQRACTDTVVALWHRNGRGDPMVRSETIQGVGSTSYLDPSPGAAGALPPAAAAALSSYCEYWA